MAASTLIRGGTVLTLGTRTQNYAKADVLVEEGRIAEIGPGLRARGAEQIDAFDTIVMPGFVDCHRHAWRTLFKNFGESGVAGTTPPTPAVYGPHYEAEDVYAATLVGLLGAAEAGITTVVDWADVPDELVDAVRQAHLDSGLRTILVRSRSGWDSQSARVLSPQSGEGLVTVAFGSDDPTFDNLGSISSDWHEARQSGERIHVHVGLDPSTQGVVAELGGRGLLGDDVTFVHCAHLSREDLDALSSSGTRVSLAPSSTMTGGMGAPPIQSLIDSSVRPGLGIGDERVAPSDMFAQMRAINSIQHATMFDLKLAGKAGLPNLLTTRGVIRYATSDGAAAVGLADTVGSLEAGKQADIIILRADRPNIAPINDPIGAVVWGMDTSNLDWVFVAGNAVMREGRLTADVEAARELATSAQRRVAGAAGLLAEAGEPA